MLVCLLRHGIAEEFDRARHLHDSERALTALGRRELTQQVKGIAAMALPIDAVVVSPYLRAQETAELVMPAFPRTQMTPPPMRISEALVPHASTEDTVEMVAALHGVAGVLLVGHEPHLSSFAALLLGDEHVALEMQRASLLGIEISRLEPPYRGVLRFLIPAKVLHSV